MLACLAVVRFAFCQRPIPYKPSRTRKLHEQMLLRFRRLYAITIQALVSSFNAPPRQGADLSEREQTVLRLLAAGLSNDQITDQLSISRNTVRHHVHNILAKLGVTNRTEAVSLAFQHQLWLCGNAFRP